MEKIKRLVVAVLLAIGTMPIIASDTWHNYLSYYEPQQIERAGNYLFVRASNALYQYNTVDQSLTTYDKVNGLSDVYITNIAWNATVGRLIIVYENSNIDLMTTSGNVVNVPDFYAKTMTEDKTVNDIYINGKMAYLATNFGVVKVNMEAAEVQEAYILDFKVDYVYMDGDNVYAASSTNGIYAASTSSNMLDKTVWKYSAPYTAQSKSADADASTLVATLSPGGPKGNLCGFMKFYNGALYMCNGMMSTKKSYVQMLKDGEWTVFSDDNISATTGRLYEDATALDIDPNNAQHVFVGARNGLYEFNNAQFVKYYDYTNSPIEAYIAGFVEYQMITGVCFDTSGNLWLLNSQAPNRSVLRLDADGAWETFDFSALMKLTSGELVNHSLANMRAMSLDSSGNIWFANDSWLNTSFYCLSPSSGALTSFTSFVNQDGTSVVNGGVTCVVEDRDGNMWIGTSAGPLYLRAADKSTENATLIQPKIPRNDGTNYADYMLSGVAINDIAIDAANRKWFATASAGVFLIDNDNETQLLHFTAEESPLLSNTVQSIEINNTTGEVFFGTDKGLCSYVSDATTPADDDDSSTQVYAYPNPVEPSYNGEIRVVGLTYNADVKIVSVDGTLIYSGRSNGGMFTWDGCDSKGRRVASGVYNVLSAREDGTKGTVCKIAIVR